MSEAELSNNSNIQSFDSNALDNEMPLANAESNGVIKNDNYDMYVVDKIIKTWQEQHQADISMRKAYAKWFLILAGGATAIVAAVFVAIGLGWLHYDEVTVHWFLSVAYIHLLGMTVVIVKYLFSRNSHVILKDVADIISKIWHRNKE